jgi:photosystem II stability/assembly factor-like uncharacterized protein
MRVEMIVRVMLALRLWLAIGAAVFAARPAAAGSNTWTVVFPHASRVLSMAIDPTNADTLYIATALPPDLLRSRDRGLSWSSLKMGTLLDGAGTLWQVSVDSQNPSHLLVISPSPSALYQSFDSGMTWSGLRFDAGILNGGQTFAFGMSHDSKTIYVAVHETCDSLYWVFLGCSGGGVLKSTDGGSTWTRTELRARAVRVMIVDPLNADIAYAITADGTESALLAILRTVDGGRTWTQIGPNASPHILVIDPMAPANLYLCANAALWTSRDRGDSWEMVKTNSGLLDPVVAFALDPIDPAGMFALSPSPPVGPVNPLDPAVPFVILRSTDSGRTWNRFIDAPSFPAPELIIDSRRTSFYVRGGDVLGYTIVGGRRHSVR